MRGYIKFVMWFFPIELIRINFFSDRIVRVGEVVSFQCLMDSPQFTALQWTRDGVVLSETGNILTVSITDTSDTGSYCCAVNGSVVHCGYIYVQGEQLHVQYCVQCNCLV